MPKIKRAQNPNIEPNLKIGSSESSLAKWSTPKSDARRLTQDRIYSVSKGSRGLGTWLGGGLRLGSILGFWAQN